MQALTSRLRGLATPGAGRAAGGTAIAASLVLFFWSHTPMWLDEAQTVWIAHQPLSHLVSGLKQDGAPPLFYVLLHGWMAVFGTSNEAVRTLPALFAALSLPAIRLLAKRLPMLQARPWVPVLLLATSPFVVRYASEARMYSLVLFLVIVASLLFERVWFAGGVGWTIGAGVVSGALLLTQYWTIYLLLTIGAAAVIAALRGNRPARRIIGALVLGAAIFAPWLPTFAYQSAHTGAPWGSPPGLDVALLALGSWVGSGIWAPWLRLSYYALVVVAVIGYAVPTGGLQLRRPARRAPLALVMLSLVAMLVGTIASQISGNAYAPRYSMIVLPFLMLAVAMGISALPARRQGVVVAALCAFGLLASIGIPLQIRTQAGEVAQVLDAHAAPTDLVVICPDQLGPALYRLAPHAGTQVVYPTFDTSAVVDWVNYKARNENASPQRFTQQVLSRAAARPIWLVWQRGYPTFGTACEDIYAGLVAARGLPQTYVQPSDTSFEQEQLAEFPLTSAASKR